jgi:hypothetical protein
MQKVGSFYLNLFIVILIAVAAFVVFHVYSQIQENKSAAKWEKTFGRIEDLPNQYPYRNDNEAADQLKMLAVQLGIDFNMSGEGNRFTPLNLDAERLKGLYRDRSAPRRDDNFWKNDDPAYIPSPLMAKYLEDYEKKLDAVKDYLLTSPPIVWRQNLNWEEYGYAKPATPNTAAIWTLQRIISCRVLELTAARNYSEAERYLEAQWKLNESLKSLPDLDSQHVALSIDEQLMTLMRKLPVKENWIPKIVQYNYEKAYMKGFLIEAWYLWRLRNEYEMTKNSVMNGIFDPYLRLGVSSELENEMEELQQLQKTNPCDIGFKEFREYQISTWNRIPSRFELHTKLNTYAEITEIKLLRELTTKVIRVKHGYFPKDGSERSEACKDGTWEFWRSPDGSTTIKYKGRIELPRTPREKFPSTFTVKAHNAARSN